MISDWRELAGPRSFAPRFSVVPLALCLSLLLSPFLARGAATTLDSSDSKLPSLDAAAWLWSTGKAKDYHFRKTFKLPEAPIAASVLITADNDYELYLNGTRVGSDEGAGAEVWQSVERYDVKALLARGLNVIAIRGGDLGGQAGVVAALRVEFKDRPPLELATDGTWRVAGKGKPEDYAHPEFVEGPEWRDARVLGPMGMAPWGKLAWSAAADQARIQRAPSQLALTPPDENFCWPEGLVFVGDDCSVYVPQRGDAWGVCFRIGDWSRAYTEFDLPCPSKIGRKLYVLRFGTRETSADVTGESHVAFRLPQNPVRTDSTPSLTSPSGARSTEGARRENPDATAFPSPLVLTNVRPTETSGTRWNTSLPIQDVTTPVVLFDAGAGCLGSPSVSFDGRFILVSLAREGEKFFHIHRIPVAGGAPQQLTDGPFHDLDPAELPDGRIVFSSTRIGTFEEYHSPPSRALFVMNADSRDIHPITFTPIFDNEPKVLADGRIIFIRSDNFFDRAKVETHLHAVRPDGTDGLTEIGADVQPDYGVRLRAFGYGSPAPLPDGRLAFISTRGNFIAAAGSAERDYQRLPDQLGDLAPLPDGRLLATVLRPAGRQRVSDVIAVIDPRHNQLVPIYESPTGSVHSPVFLGARARPPVIPDYVDRSREDSNTNTGFLFCQDVRFTQKVRADWRQMRAIRVLGAVGLTTRSSHSHIVHAGHETVELGTVPLAPDGSFFVEVPADMPLALQAVDAEGRSELNEMSWIYVRPGEKRSCLGCHNPRQATPPFHNHAALALRAPPLKLLGQGEPHRFRGNNAGVTGMTDLQFERFRECASLNRHTGNAGPLVTGQDEITALIDQLGGRDAELKISAAQRLAIFHNRSAASALVERLPDENREVRVAVALALAACGNRDSVPGLLNAMEDRDPVVAQAAVVALSNLIGGEVAKFNAFADLPERQGQVGVWREWFRKYNWDAIERALIPRIRMTAPDPPRRALVALGHIGGEAARAALREWVATVKDQNPYPKFENDNRTDTFTFPSDSPWNPRPRQEAVRALGHLRDASSIPLLAEILAHNLEPKTANLFLAEAAIEALGRIGTPEAETVLIDTFSKLKDYWEYVGWYSDHPALYACHSSPLHARLIEALEALGSKRTASLVPHLIRSVPTDPDRALFPDNDDYETLVGRIIRRSGRSAEVIETCLAILGDAQAQVSAMPLPSHVSFPLTPALSLGERESFSPALEKSRDSDPNLRAEKFLRLPEGEGRGEGNGDVILNRHGSPEIRFAIATTWAAWAGKPGPENRASQILSLVCRDQAYEPRIRDAFERFRAQPEETIARELGNPTWTPVRHWVLFYLARSLGNLADRRSVDALVAALADDLNEARHGRPDPSQPEIHFLQLEYTPCWRAAAAHALGRIGDPRAVPALLRAAANLDNATDVRHSAAKALGKIADPASLPDLRKLAANYPEVSTRRALVAACEALASNAESKKLAMRP